jgi:hypothetical protein
MGWKVVAIDNPMTNHNGMQGARALKARLHSSIELREADLDAQFSLEDQRFGLAIFLGTLYHLKNPFHMMETLARVADYCILSTRIARKLPDGSPIRPDMPLAYLLDTYELNSDDSNYWIFSEAGLRRLLKRTGWDTCEYITVGDKRRSDPVSIDHDERAFYLLRSHYGLAHLRLITGWHEADAAGWRWTEKSFSIGLPSDAAQSCKGMTMRVFIPPALINQLGPLRLDITANGQELKPVAFEKAGPYTFERRLRLNDSSLVQFSLDKCLRPGDSDERELGIIVASIEFE